MTTYYSEYSKVYVSVDCIIFGFDEGQLRVLIGKRQLTPDGASGHCMADSSVPTRALMTQQAVHCLN